MAVRILVVDDEPLVRSTISALCRALGHETIEADSATSAQACIAAHEIDLVLLDLGLPGKSGMQALPELAQGEDAPSVIILTGLGDVPTAVEAMRRGATDFLQKPVRLEVLEPALARAVAARRVRHERDRLRGELARLQAGPVVGESGAIRAVLDVVERVAATPRTTVLIQGESGVGKELVARAVHDRSSRARGPFLAVNCAALAEGLLESELFGYEPGAFTGASSKGKDGLFAQAEGGSLFLDEIGELGLELQAKLLRVLQERVYRRVGASNDRPMDVRILASTNRDLNAMVAAGTFREDLYYRLNVMSIRVPPLRERVEDIPILATHFLAHFEREFRKSFSGFAPAALTRLVEYGWPGNVRELRNAVERAALLAPDGEIQIAHLRLDAPSPRELGHAPTALATVTSEGRPLLAVDDFSLASVERALILRVLSEAEGNRSRAARMLGVNRTTLYNKLKAYALDA
ncbi:MAG: sigma-54-dependent Fis family transcriptional regulator [Planctomycetes bacterium]|nr:sigma-54-dependent Fis family transcriptional regulator [Planctomycetota bacterium]